MPFLLVRALTATILLLTPTIGMATGAKVGPEFRVNSYTPNVQNDQRVSSDGTGGFVVVWLGYSPDDPSRGSFARRFDSSGAPVGTEFLVNTTTAGLQGGGDVAPDGSGGFVVVFHTITTTEDLLGQRFDATGAKVGTTEFPVNVHVPGNQGQEAVASMPGGGFVVAWFSEPPGAVPALGQDGDGLGVFGRLFDASGSPLTGEIQINSYTTQDQWFPQVEANGAGDFLVVWQSEAGQDGSATGVFGRLFDASGLPLTGDIQINSYTTQVQSQARVHALDSNDFVVVWQSYLQESGAGAEHGIFGQRISSGGGKIGSEFPVNVYTTGDQRLADVGPDGEGGFVVAWESKRVGTFKSIVGRRYDAVGNPFGPEFPVNTYTSQTQKGPRVAADGGGGFVITWYGYNNAALDPADPGAGGDLDESAVIAQRFTNCGNGAVEGAEECDDGNNDPGDGCDASCQLEKFFCCDDETTSCNSDATCGAGSCCSEGRCNVGGVSPMCDASGGLCATNGDCGGEECCANGECGNGIVEPGEECDLGSSNNATGLCNLSCQAQGTCTQAGTPCVDPGECPLGEGCCGDGSTTAPDEECDDGNFDGGDCCLNDCTESLSAVCVPPCPNIGGPQLLQAASMKAKFDDKNRDDPLKDGDGKYERWKIGRKGQNGDFNLDAGQHTDCRSEEMEISFIENDGNDVPRILGTFHLNPAVWDKKKPLLSQDGSVAADDQCKLSDKTEMKSVPPGVSKAQWREKGVKVKYRFQGKLLGEIEQPTSFVEPVPGEDPEGNIRACVRVGASAGHSVLSCTLRRNGEQLKCQSDN